MFNTEKVQLIIPTQIKYFIKIKLIIKYARVPSCKKNDNKAKFLRSIKIFINIYLIKDRRHLKIYMTFIIQLMVSKNTLISRNSNSIFKWIKFIYIASQ